MGLRVEVVTVTPFQQNCSVIWCEQTLQGAVIDPGGDIDQIMKVIVSNQLRVSKILLTHGHLDHAGGAAALSRELEVKIIGPHQQDEFWLEGMEKQAQSYGFAGVEICHPDQWLNDGDRIDVGNETLEVYHCPGHTPGHVIFFHRQSHLAFVGDVLFKGSIGRTDFPRGDFNTLINSITQKLWPLGNETRFVSGHGPLSSFGVERESNPFVSDSALLEK
ncbi:MBL fold metallo-hydrolase [Aliikangiella sp. G2MR2-5]|uniref:MBL fold metallo-hydrolase n=1 Tax=Aliikangiella sp. G2MR2-5 TaxID=2788943 RepID=UPI0018AA687B|nr:MBL fold metallo-hydrolase [Aliikangiella sp. G2MR2-5]